MANESEFLKCFKTKTATAQLYFERRHKDIFDSKEDFQAETLILDKELKKILI